PGQGQRRPLRLGVERLPGPPAPAGDAGGGELLGGPVVMRRPSGPDAQLLGDAAERAREPHAQGVGVAADLGRDFFPGPPRAAAPRRTCGCAAPPRPPARPRPAGGGLSGPKPPPPPPLCAPPAGSRAARPAAFGRS